MTNEFIKAAEIEIRREESEYKDLMQDFEFVKEMNRVMSVRYQEVFDCFPTVEEIDHLIDTMGELYLAGSEKDKTRLIKLRKFRSALRAIAANDPQIKPRRYEDLEK